MWLQVLVYLWGILLKHCFFEVKHGTFMMKIHSGFILVAVFVLSFFWGWGVGGDSVLILGMGYFVVLFLREGAFWGRGGDRDMSIQNFSELSINSHTHTHVLYVLAKYSTLYIFIQYSTEDYAPVYHRQCFIFPRAQRWRLCLSHITQNEYRGSFLQYIK